MPADGLSPIHPGEYLKEALEKLGFTQAQLRGMRPLAHVRQSTRTWRSAQN